VTTGSGQTTNVTFVSISQVYVNISLRSTRLVNRVIFVRVINASGTAVVSSVGGFRMGAAGRFAHVRLLQLVAMSQARVAAGGIFRLQFSTNRQFAGAVLTTAAFRTRSRVTPTTKPISSAGPPVSSIVTTGSGQTTNVTFVSISQVYVNVSLRSSALVNQVIYVRVINANGTAVVSSVGGFRMGAAGRFARIRLLQLVAMSQARVAAGGIFRLQFSTNRQFASAVFTTAAFQLRAVHHGHAHKHGKG
jgi:hypothetical protein